MGSYGIGIARTMAGIVEQHHDEQGIVWPSSVAPYDVHVVARRKLRHWLQTRPAVLNPRQVESIFGMARRSTTWH